MKDLDQEILEDIEPILEGMGFYAVEVRTVQQKTGPKVYIVITKKGGVNVEDTAEVLKTLRPRIQLLLDAQDIFLEVSSPGIDRIFKHPREYRVFRERGVKILTASNNEWIGGILDSVEEDHVFLRQKGQTRAIPFSQIKKAKLDYSEEV
ncbi:MAG: ribosome maturation factor RimP [Spirochaetales bacterium]|nr:ribosome maturation factor RimP [Spirochaetales bacterium]